MKIMCQCGKNVSYEIPFDNFATIRISCTSVCKPETRKERLSDVMFASPVKPTKVGMLGH